MAPDEWVEEFARYLQHAPGFRIQTPDYGLYDHMGATLTEAIMQQSLNWDAQVKPVVGRIQALPTAHTTSGFLNGPPIPVLVGYGFKGKAVERLAQFFAERGVETEAGLRKWLGTERNLRTLLDVKQVGQKTVDYLKNLVGAWGVAVDTHIRRTAIAAGIPAAATYDQLKELVEAVAAKFDVSSYILDYSIWTWSARRRGV